MINLKLIVAIQQIAIVYLIYKLTFYEKLEENMPISRNEIINDIVKNKPTGNKHVWIEEFRRIAIKHRTDKATSHDYHNMYGTLLGPMRDQNVSLLEIGLGCTMAYGPGKSIPVWREFLPFVKLSILEYDGSCAEKFRNRVEQLFVGDQSDFNVLRDVANGGPYDVVVDDGGHQVSHQINSLIGLWPVLKSGGVYFIEDLYLYHVKGFNDPNKSTFDWIYKLSFLLVSHIPTWDTPNIIPHNVTFPKEVEDIYKTVFSVNCFHRACVLIKK